RDALAGSRRKARTAPGAGLRIRRPGAASMRQTSSAIDLTSAPKVAMPSAAVDGRHGARIPCGAGWRFNLVSFCFERSVALAADHRCIHMSESQLIHLAADLS